MQALDCPLFFTTKKQSSPIKASLMKGEKGDGLTPTLFLSAKMTVRAAAGDVNPYYQRTYDNSIFFQDIPFFYDVIACNMPIYMIYW